MKHKILLILFITILLGCTAPPANKLVIAVRGNSFNDFPVNMAFELKYLEKENFLVKYYPTGKKAFNAVKNHKADLAICDFAHAFEKNNSTEVLSPLIRQGFGLAANWQIKEFSQLKGKTVGVIKHSTGHLMWLLTNTDTEIKLQEFDSFDKMFTAYKKGKISGFVDNAASILKKRLSSSVIKWFNQKFPHHLNAVIVQNKSIKNTKAELISRFIKAINASQLKLADPNFSTFSAIKIYKLNEEICQKTIANTYFFTNKLQQDNSFLAIAGKKMLDLKWHKNQNAFENFFSFRSK